MRVRGLSTRTRAKWENIGKSALALPRLRVGLVSAKLRANSGLAPVLLAFGFGYNVCSTTRYPSAVSGAVMAKSKKKCETVFLVCEETGDYNYTLRRKPGGEKLKLKKYSPRLRKHTLHLEKKK
jgi:large subunit ribosomal protein L33